MSTVARTTDLLLKGLRLIHAALKVMKERYKMWHLPVQGERTGTGQLTVAQVLEKVAKL